MNNPVTHLSSGSVEAIIHDFYDVISGLAGEERDWDRMRSMFIPGARLIPNSVVCSSSQLSAVGIDAYIEKLSAFLRQCDFFETGFICHVEVFGNIANVVSTYEARHAQDDTVPGKQGVNFIHLLDDGKQWRITGMIWKDAGRDIPIPEVYCRPTAGSRR